MVFFHNINEVIFSGDTFLIRIYAFKEALEIVMSNSKRFIWKGGQSSLKYVDLVILLSPGLLGPQATFPGEFKTCMVEVMRDTHSFVKDNKRRTSTLKTLHYVNEVHITSSSDSDLSFYVSFSFVGHDKDLGENCSFQGVPSSIPLRKERKRD